jgi:hypothetical protein
VQTANKKVRKTKRNFFSVYIGEKELGCKVREEADKEIFQTGLGPFVLINFIPKEGNRIKAGILMTDNRVFMSPDLTFTDLFISVATFDECIFRAENNSVICEGKLNYEMHGKKVLYNLTIKVESEKVSYSVERETELMKSSMSSIEMIKRGMLREDGSILLETAGGNIIVLNPDDEKIREALLPKSISSSSAEE